MKFGLECFSGLHHEFVVVSPAFDDAGFEATGSVSDSALGDQFQDVTAVTFHSACGDVAQAQRHPCR